MDTRAIGPERRALDFRGGGRNSRRNDQRPRTDPSIEGPVLGRCFSAPTASAAHVPNSGRLVLSCDWSLWMIDECICETRDSLRSSVAPISFIVSSS